MEARLWAQAKYATDLKNLDASWFSRFGRKRPQNGFWDSHERGKASGLHRLSPWDARKDRIQVTGMSPHVKRRHFTPAMIRPSTAVNRPLLPISPLICFKNTASMDMKHREVSFTSGLCKGWEFSATARRLNVTSTSESWERSEFADEFLKMIAYRKGIGDDFAEGFFRAAKRWGRLEEDLKTGVLPYSYWGLPEHGYDPRAEVEWGYGSILGDRDINEHDFNFLFWWPSGAIWAGKTPQPPAEQVVRIIAEKLIPYENDPLMLDFSTDNIYSEHMAKLVAWHRHYTRFWKESVLYCDHRWPEFINSRIPGYAALRVRENQGSSMPSPGRNSVSLTEWNWGERSGTSIMPSGLFRADTETWSISPITSIMCHIGGSGNYAMYYLPGREKGRWDYIRVNGRCLDKAKFEEFKTRFYNLEGWDTRSGWPKRRTLESLGLKFVADELEKNKKMGSLMK